jgi:hypothetical protein
MFRLAFTIGLVTFVILRGSGRAFISLIFEEGGYSVLLPELFPCFLCQIVDNFPGQSDAGHGVQDNLIRNHIAHVQDLSI